MRSANRVPEEVREGGTKRGMVRERKRDGNHVKIGYVTRHGRKRVVLAWTWTLRLGWPEVTSEASCASVDHFNCPDTEPGVNGVSIEICIDLIGTTGNTRPSLESIQRRVGPLLLMLAVGWMDLVFTGEVTALIMIDLNHVSGNSSRCQCTPPLVTLTFRYQVYSCIPSIFPSSRGPRTTSDGNV